MSLSQNVAAARKKKGLTQEELANLANITVRTIQRIENGQTIPRPYTLKTIAAALDTSFDALQPLEMNSKATDKTSADAVHFLQLLCLSCFSYLVLPFVHFLIPMRLLRNRNEEDPRVTAYARSVIRNQIFWIVALVVSFLLVLAYNIICSVYFNPSYYISYLVPFFVMYFLNAVIICIAFVRSKRVILSPQVADNQ